MGNAAGSTNEFIADLDYLKLSALRLVNLPSIKVICPEASEDIVLQSRQILQTFVPYKRL